MCLYRICFCVCFVFYNCRIFIQHNAIRQSEWELVCMIWVWSVVWERWTRITPVACCWNCGFLMEIDRLGAKSFNVGRQEKVQRSFQSRLLSVSRCLYLSHFAHAVSKCYTHLCHLLHSTFYLYRPLTSLVQCVTLSIIFVLLWSTYTPIVNCSNQEHPLNW